jgi:hypothetical protein
MLVASYLSVVTATARLLLPLVAGMDAFVAWVFDGTPSSEGALWMEAFALVVVTTIALVAFVSAINAAILMVCSMAFGLLTASCALSLEVTAEAAPPGVWTIYQVDFDKAAPGSSLALQHSASYSDPRALDAIARWIKESEAVVDGHARVPDAAIAL